MAFLYVLTDGARIRKTGERILVLDLDEKVVEDIELARLEGVLMLGTVHVTTQALVELLEHGVEFSIMSGKGKLLGRLVPPNPKNVGLRRAQFEKEQDPAFVIARTREVVAAKIENQREVLTRFALDEPGEQPAIAHATRDMLPLLKSLETADQVDVLRGYEGAAAKLYWGAFPEMLKAEGVLFEGRRQHPSPDPVNAALSFAYVLLGNLFRAFLEGVGFDPALGFFHQPAYGRPSLALDLLEPFRAPLVDRFVVRLFNLRMVKPGDFESDGEGGVRLNKEAIKVFFREWERALHKANIRHIIREQSLDLRKVYLGESDTFSPYRWRAR